MEHAKPPVMFKLGGREIALRFTARSWRLIKEHTHFDILGESGKAAESGTNSLDPFRSWLLNAVNFPRVLWAAMQNSENNPVPEFDWVEDALSLENLADAITAVTQAFPKQSGSQRGNGLAGADAPTGLNSGPPAQEGSASVPATSGN